MTGADIHRVLRRRKLIGKSEGLELRRASGITLPAGSLVTTPGSEDDVCSENDGVVAQICVQA